MSPSLKEPIHPILDNVAEHCKNLFISFLEQFIENGKRKYVLQGECLFRPERNTLYVSMNDLEGFNPSLANAITDEYYRLYPYFCEAAKCFCFKTCKIPQNKDIYVGFMDVANRHKLRELTTNKVGSLIRISGQVVRSHPVHPELVKATFICVDCQTVIENVEQQFKYTQPNICKNALCQNRIKFILDVNRSKFLDFQRVRIQETQSELPRGSIPRSIEIVLRSEAVELAQAGDRCDFIGCLIVVPDVSSLSLPGAKAELSCSTSTSSGVRVTGSTNVDSMRSDGVTGLKSLGVRDLSYRLSFLACSVVQTSAKFGGKNVLPDELTPEAMRKVMTDQEWQKIFEMSQDPNLYNNLVSSLFPTIHGADDVKRGILLMLFGGVAKVTTERTSLRGDINICIVGDPSISKSQFLKHVEAISPRAVYTSGKASTAAGLTAAVVKDEESHEFVIEAGALMLADHGICCIDEFDKMDLKDQVAIHEAMEQQTISITKAGIKATLNARTSILAAANPIGGRYDKSRSLRQNIALSAPIMSRFDLLFVLVDECDEFTDYAIARCIIGLHSNPDKANVNIYTMEEIQRYILFSKNFKPTISKDSQNFIVEQYKYLRQRDFNSISKSAWRITVRQLESMIRLSEALAKLHCSDAVEAKHVREAYRLLNKSIIHVEPHDLELYQHVHLSSELVEDSMQIDSENIPVNSSTINSSLPVGKYSSQTRCIKISYENYKSISNLIVLYLRDMEDNLLNDSGVRRSELVHWYLKEVELDIHSESQLEETIFIVNKIIDKLILEDHVLIALQSTTAGMVSDEHPLSNRNFNQLDDEIEHGNNPVLVVHPNYIMD